MSSTLYNALALQQCFLASKYGDFLNVSLKRMSPSMIELSIESTNRLINSKMIIVGSEEASQFKIADFPSSHPCHLFDSQSIIAKVGLDISQRLEGLSIYEAQDVDPNSCIIGGAYNTAVNQYMFFELALIHAIHAWWPKAAIFRATEEKGGVIVRILGTVISLSLNDRCELQCKVEDTIKKTTYQNVFSTFEAGLSTIDSTFKIREILDKYR